MSARRASRAAECTARGAILSRSFFVVGFAEVFSPKGGLTPRGLPPQKKGGPRVVFMESLYSRRHARAKRGSRVSRRRVRGVTRRACRSFGAPFAALGAVRDDGRSSSHLRAERRLRRAKQTRVVQWHRVMCLRRLAWLAYAYGVVVWQ